MVEICLRGKIMIYRCVPRVFEESSSVICGDTFLRHFLLIICREALVLKYSMGQFKPHFSQ